jgi:hypothetical protein
MLIGAALLFWGWQTGLLPVAVLLACLRPPAHASYDGITTSTVAGLPKDEDHGSPEEHRKEFDE